MKWEEMQRSENIEDRRGQGGGLTRMPGGVTGLGLGGILLALLASLFLGINPLDILGGVSGGGPAIVQQAPQTQPSGGVNDKAKDFVSRVVGDTERVWGDIFAKSGREYQEPRLVLFEGGVRSACGTASSASGPFYCSLDSQVYLDTSFFGELRNRFGVEGEFAYAYVIAHEIGHHVQNQLGISRKVQAMRSRMSEVEGNQLSVRQELQADCFAGVWANNTAQRDLINRGDIDAAIKAATEIGDDRLQRRSQGYVIPDAFTHGSSQQRVRWFEKGLESGDPNQCDAFSAQRL
jgi:hypothetical protein